jgi:hypothetical protein
VPDIAGFWHMPDSGPFCWNLVAVASVGIQRLDSKIRRLAAVESGYQQIPVPGRFSQTCVCKNEEFKSRKRFTDFKTVNRFLKIKEVFTVKKIIYVDHYFCSYQTPENAENILRRNKWSIRLIMFLILIKI